METTITPVAFKQTGFFKGEADNPLLAPRGVYFHNPILVISDTGQNRVFIWKHFAGDSFQTADVVLGQSTHTDTERNKGTSVSASGLQYPSGVWTNGQQLIVADAWNHRVLIWLQFPSRHGQPADVVIGQPGFEKNEPNVKGLGHACSVQSLYWPYGVWSDGKQLWIADTGNRRVLYYENIPTENFSAADAVIGQENFSEKEYHPENAIWPYSVKINADGAMLITDTQYYRVLYWSNWKEALTQKASLLIGQPDLNANGQNQFRLKPAAHTLNWCYDACFYQKGIIVADTGNSRLLVYEHTPAENNAAADSLIGQPHFEVNGESSLSMKTNIENEMYWPFAVHASNETLVVADTGNHRVLFYQPVSESC